MGIQGHWGSASPQSPLRQRPLPSVDLQRSSAALTLTPTPTLTPGWPRLERWTGNIRVRAWVREAGGSYGVAGESQAPTPFQRDLTMSFEVLERGVHRPCDKAVLVALSTVAGWSGETWRGRQAV